MRAKVVLRVALVVSVALGLLLLSSPASACHPDPGGISVGDPGEGPYVAAAVMSGCPHQTGACVRLQGSGDPTCFIVEL